MSLVRQTINLLANSDTTVGARNKSSDGSSFSIQLDNPITIPRDAVGASVSATQASVWNLSYNISDAIGNNIFDFTIGDGGGTFTIIIPNGMYSLETFDLMIQRQLTILGLDSDLFAFSGDEATQKVVITFKSALDVINFDAPNSCREILGFDARTVPNAPNTDLVEVADRSAAFNRVNSYVIQTDLVSHGIPINNSAASVLANIPVSAKPGSLIVYEPRHPTQVDATELVGQSKNYFTLSLRDQNGRAVDTIGENWTVLIEIQYFIPYNHFQAR